MKVRHLIVFAVGASLLIGPAMAAEMAADDPMKVAPSMYKLLYENDQVRVMEVTFKPGEKIAKHTHPNDHYIVVMEPGKLKISKPDGSASDADLKKEQVMWIPAETHWAQNTGKTTVKLIVNEIKSAGGAGASGGAMGGSATESGAANQQPASGSEPAPVKEQPKTY